MAYNKFRWWTRGKPIKPLKAEAPLLLKIRNGDFDYSYMFTEAKLTKDKAKSVYDLTYKNYIGDDERNRIATALDESRMQRLKGIKLELEADKDEKKTLWRLQKELEREFGKDLWDKAMERQRGKGTLEDLYYWYKKQCKIGTTKSEMDIQLKRKNVTGLEYLL